MLKSRIDALFEQAVSYPKGFAILVRKGGAK